MNVYREQLHVHLILSPQPSFTEREIISELSNFLIKISVLFILVVVVVVVAIAFIYREFSQLSKFNKI